MKVAQEFECLVMESALFELMTPRSLGLVVFRLVPPAPDASQPPSREILNALNLDLHQRITHPEDPADALFITRTELNDDVCLRMAIGAERTTEMHVKKAIDTLERVGKNILKEAGYTIDGDEDRIKVGTSKIANVFGLAPVEVSLNRNTTCCLIMQ